MNSIFKIIGSEGEKNDMRWKVKGAGYMVAMKFGP